LPLADHGFSGLDVSRGVAELSSLVGCDTLCLGDKFPAFWRNSAYIFKGLAVPEAVISLYCNSSATDSK